MTGKIFRIGCSKPKYDDIGKILRRMGYEFDVLPKSSFKNANVIQQYDIIFLNCGGAPSPDQKSLVVIREFVDSGGALYASDWSYTWIEQLFPNLADFHINDNPEEIEAFVTDKGLKEYLGIDRVKIHFDLEAWRNPTKLNPLPGTKIYLTSSRRNYDQNYNDGGCMEEPLLFSYNYGKGVVIFTAFHNEQQVSEIEAKLLEYLVLKPLMHESDTTSKTIMATKMFRNTQEIIGALKTDDETQTYLFVLLKPADLKFIFNWVGKAITRITIIRPDQSIYFDQNVSSIPFELDVTNAQPGNWGYKLKIVDAPVKKFPFTINVGLKDSLQAKINKQNKQNHQILDNFPQVTQKSPIFELLAPERRFLKQISVPIGKNYILGRNDLPKTLSEIEMISSHHFEIKVISKSEIILTDHSSNGTRAAHYVGGPYLTQKLQNGIPITLQLPVIVQVASHILLGIYFQ